MKRKLVVWFLLVLLVFGMQSALAGYNIVIDPVTGHEELIFDWEGDTDGWGDGELGDESVPLYALGGLAVIAATGAVLMHKKRVHVG